MRQLEDKWTDAQRDAIRSRNETLLVSAAAGSGKTAVLTERIIDRLLAEENAIELSSILVVTFTKAAAAELKTRIRQALDRELAKDPGNKRLHTQLYAVSRAKICTIDSYCLDLIRANFETLGLSSGISVSDEAQAHLLSSTVMEALIDDYYNGDITNEADAIDDFGAFAENLVSARASDTLSAVLLDLRETVNGYEEGVSWFGTCAETLAANAGRDFLADDNPLSAPLRARLREFCDTMRKKYADAMAFLSSDPLYLKNYGDCFLYEREWLETLAALLARGADYDTVRTHMTAFDAPTLKSGIRGDKKTPEVLRVKALHEAFAEQRKKDAARFFAMPASDIAAVCAKQAAFTEQLYRFMRLFEARLAEEKARRQTLDFGDLGRYARKLLWDEEHGCPTQAALQEAAKYSEIYIDEYQDVSPVQDRIFSAIAKRDNRFMVGDAKQSIYGFRGASPELFLGYRAAFAADPGEGRTIFLSNNFRCDGQIIDLCNMVFSVLFGQGGGKLPYTADDALICSKRREGEDVQSTVTLALLSDSHAEDTEDGEDDGGDGTPQPAEPITDSPEADWIAAKIAELLSTGVKRSGERLRPRDIAILVRSAKSSAEPIALALEKHHIPSFNAVSRAFFENAEVLLVYSLLTVIDNPQKDVYLAGALRSPLYHVTLDELVYLRQTCPDGSLYDALTAFVAQTGFAKGAYFLEQLEKYRRIAAGMPVDRFLWLLYQDTGILSMVYEKEARTQLGEDTDSEQMRANLMMLYEYARSFEHGTFRGLYQFVLFIEDVMAEKAQLPPVQLEGEDADAVRIMTVHQSKGLEFPVCFLAGLGKKRNEADLRKPVLLNREAGIASYLHDDTGLVKLGHPVRECLKQVISDAQAEEEMRIFYVALTRAREQLYLSAAVKDTAKKLKACEDAADLLTPTALRAEKTMLGWLLMAAAANPGFPGLTVLCPDAAGLSAEEPEQKETPEAMAAPEKPQSDGISYAAARRLIRERLSFVYPDEARTVLPAKTAVSDLVRGEQEAQAGGNGSAEYARPRFLMGTDAAAATAAQRGTATHEFMQFCDYGRLEKNGIDAEIAYLLEKCFLTAETAERIDRAALKRFTESALFARLRCAKEIRREVRFNLRVPANRLTGADTDASVLVQGIMDCFFTDGSGKLILLDYKTDHFSGELLRSDPAAAEAILRERHGLQLSYYRAACEKLLCRHVDEVRIYSFALGYDFPVETENI